MNECKGCNDFTDGQSCFIRDIGSLEDIKLCPCRDCLIKVMCFQACDEYGFLSEKIDYYMVGDA